ncbi:MAG: PKD domain-containing protein [Bacteroidetes bacterium]|nr:MAG: PKD domain-containing protein [Bacteroidota bacterium]
MGPPPYNHVGFQTGYSYLDPFGSGNFTIDPQTGFINVTPTQTGIFVFSISVFEYRDGVLLSENRRDFQIHVINCLPPGQPPTISHDLSGLNTSGDTIFVEAGEAFCYDVTVQDPVPTSGLISYTVSAPFGNGNFVPPAATYTSSGTNPIQGQVCWTPACAYDGQVVPLIIGAFDDEDCENFSDVFDTVWISVSVPPNQPPVIQPNLSGLDVSNDTIFVNATDSLCFPFTVSDPNAGNLINVFPISPVFSSPNNPAAITFSGTNPVSGEVCWVPGCNLEGQVVELTFGASDVTLCNSPGNTQTTLYVAVQIPPNNPPALTTNLSGNVFSNDTIFVEALENLCFSFNGTDPDAGDVLSALTAGAVFSGPTPPTVTTNGSNPLGGQICWTPSCAYENQVVPIIFGVADPGVCSNIGQAFDTVYVSVSVPANQPPAIVSDLSGNTFSNDTVFVEALSNFCFDFTATDPDAGTQLTGLAVTPLFNTVGGPTFTTSGNNPLQGQVCWTPSCDFADQVVQLIFGAEDDAPCSAQAEAFDTVYVAISAPPNDPPLITPDLSGLSFDGDTIFADATVPFCYTLTFSDINLGDTLTAAPISPIFSGTNAATFTVTGINPLQGQVCWTPGCENEGEIIEFIVAVQDNGACGNIKTDRDTIYVKISDPLTIPPIVDHDLSGLSAVGGDTAFIEIGDGLCYEFYIADQTPDNGMTYTYEFQNIDGLNLGLSTANVIFRNDSILGQICFTADCSNGGSLYRSIVTGIDKETCPPFQQTSDTVYIKVNTEFMAFAGSDTFFCEGGGGVQLNVTPIGGEAPYYFDWGCTNPGQCGFSNGNNNDQSPVVNPTDTTTYFVQITDKNGCTSEFDDVTVFVRKLPIADAGPDVSICEGLPGTRLQCNVINPDEAPPPYTYQWLPAAGLSDPTVVDPWAQPDTTTIYTVLVTSANGCSSANTTLNPLSTVVVTVKPRPVADAGPDFDICLGEETQLLGFANEAGPTYEYAWTPSVGLSDSSVQAPVSGPPLTTTYFLVVWSNGCPSVADSATVTVHTIPTVNPGPPYEVCAADSVQLTSTVGGDPLATEYSYQWEPAIGLSDPTAAEPLASPPQTTTYTLTATSNFGCGSNGDTVTVRVLPSPQALAGPDTFLCRGDSIALAGGHTLLGGSLPPDVPVFYSWAPAGGLSLPTIPDPLAGPRQTQLYVLTTRAGSCATRDSVLVEVFEPVVATAWADTSRICEGDSVHLYAVGGQGNASFSWSPAGYVGQPQQASPLAAPDTTTVFTVLVREGVCADTAQVRVAVNPSPSVNYFTSLDEGCAPLSIGFFGTSTPGTAYVWDFGDGSPLSNEINPEHTYQQPGTYPVRLTVVGPGGCTATDASRRIQVTDPGMARFIVDLGEDFTALLPDAAVSFINQSTGGVQYFWDFGDGGFSSALNPIHIYQEAGEYTATLTVTDESGCISQYQLGPIFILDPDLFVPNVFSPNADGVNDRFLVEYRGKEVLNLEIYDRWGRMVHSHVGDPGDGWDGTTPSGEPAHAGVYYYLLRIGEASYNGSVTLLR